MSISPSSTKSKQDSENKNIFVRCFLVSCLIALAVHAVNADGGPGTDAGIPAKIAKGLLIPFFTGAAANCLGEAVIACESHWKNPAEVIKCGKDFLAANKGRCIVGK